MTTTKIKFHAPSFWAGRVERRELMEYTGFVVSRISNDCWKETKRRKCCPGSSLNWVLHFCIHRTHNKQMIAREISTVVGIPWTTVRNASMRRYARELALSFMISLNKSYSICGTGKWWTKFSTNTCRITLIPAMPLTRSAEIYYPQMPFWHQ